MTLGVCINDSWSLLGMRPKLARNFNAMQEIAKEDQENSYLHDTHLASVK